MFEKLFNLPVVFIGIFLGFVFFTAGMGRLTHGHYFPLTMFPISLAKLLEPDGELSFIGNRHLDLYRGRLVAAGSAKKGAEII